MFFLSVILWSSCRGYSVDPDQSLPELTNKLVLFLGQNVLPFYSVCEREKSSASVRTLLSTHMGNCVYSKCIQTEKNQ